MSAYPITTQAQVRAAFWNTDADRYMPAYRAWKRQNDYNTDTRCAFVDFVDGLVRDGQISEALAHRVTL